jgi:general L-amino acid transport system permease protein
MVKILRNKKFRDILLQLFVFLAVFFIVFFLYRNLQENLIKNNIATGFSFLHQESGFEISESIFDFSSSQTYGNALWVGLFNSLKVSILGNVLAVILGTFIGIFALAKNNLLRNLAKSYIEIIRNIPLLLQLFFWYALFSDVFPGVRQSYNPIDGFFISNRGIFFPSVEFNSSVFILLSSLVLCVLIFLILRAHGLKKRVEYGITFPYKKISLAIFAIVFPCTFLFVKSNLKISHPNLAGFNFEGGFSLSPEFCSLLLGLSLYTSAFMAEIIRSGILAVSKGQSEAAAALGLSKFQTLWMVILPQAMRTIIPPITNQVLNLTKNSSLAVAIAYPDFVSIANTTMNQTGQAVELILLIIVVYLSFSLITSLFMNWFNKKMALVER